MGCTENSSSDDKKRLIGEWYGTYYDSTNNITFEMIFTFYDNDTAQNVYYS